MSCVQIEWFYGKFNRIFEFLILVYFSHIEFLLNHPEIIYKYSHWFNEDIKPIIDDPIYLKQCQLKNMIENSKK